MRHPRLAERLYNAPLLLMPEKAEVIERVFASYQAGDEASLPKYAVEEHAALLVPARRTEAGYSLTDTVVVFDRIRENLKARRTEPMAKVVNDSVNETLSRTINTSLTTLLTVVVLFVWGGEVVHSFSLALILGIAVGTYSSIFVASPLLVEWNLRSPAKR